MSEHNKLHPFDFIIIYIGGAFIAGWLQQLLRQAFPAIAEGTVGLLLSGLWLQDGLMLALLVLCLRVRRANWQDVGARRPEGRHPLLGPILWGLAMYVIMTVMIQIINALWPGGLAAQNVQGYMQPDDALWQKLFVVLTMGVFVPIVEELIFRGYLFHSLAASASPQTAMLFTALIFGAAHLDLQRFLPLALGGYLLNIVAVRHRSTFASAISHGVWNTVMIVLYYYAI